MLDTVVLVIMTVAMVDKGNSQVEGTVSNDPARAGELMYSQSARQQCGKW